MEKLIINQENLPEVLQKLHNFLNNKKFSAVVLEREQANINVILKTGQQLVEMKKIPPIHSKHNTKEIIFAEIIISITFKELTLIVYNTDSAFKNPFIKFNEEAMYFFYNNCLGRLEMFGFSPEIS